MSDHKKIPTSAEVYAVIFARHRDQLKPFASFSDPTGTFMGRDGSTGTMETEWGIAGSFPLIGIRTTWPILVDDQGHAKDGERSHLYWLCCGERD